MSIAITHTCGHVGNWIYDSHDDPSAQEQAARPCYHCRVAHAHALGVGTPYVPEDMPGILGLNPSCELGSGPSMVDLVARKGGRVLERAEVIQSHPTSVTEIMYLTCAGEPRYGYERVSMYSLDGFWQEVMIASRRLACEEIEPIMDELTRRMQERDRSICQARDQKNEAAREAE